MNTRLCLMIRVAQCEERGLRSRDKGVFIFFWVLGLIFCNLGCYYLLWFIGFSCFWFKLVNKPVRGSLSFLLASALQVWNLLKLAFELPCLFRFLAPLI